MYSVSSRYTCAFDNSPIVMNLMAYLIICWKIIADWNQERREVERPERGLYDGGQDERLG